VSIVKRNRNHLLKNKHNIKMQQQNSDLARELARESERESARGSTRDVHTETIANEDNEKMENTVETNENKSLMEKDDNEKEKKLFDCAETLFNLVGESQDVTRADKDMTEVLKALPSIREECEEKLSTFSEEGSSETVWSYDLHPSRAVLRQIHQERKCSGIANITILFRGSSTSGILRYVDSAYLTLNGRVIDIATMAAGQDDPRVSSFRSFDEEKPFMFSCMSPTDSLKIFIRFRLEPPFEKEMIRILADLCSFSGQEAFTQNSWKQKLVLDSSQCLLFDPASASSSRLSVCGGFMSESPRAILKRMSRGWPQQLIQLSDSDCSDKDSDSGESENSRSSKQSHTSLHKSSEYSRDKKMKQEKERGHEREIELLEIREREERSRVCLEKMAEALHARRRAYSEDDESADYIRKLFRVPRGLSAEAEALCAIEIARWKTQRKLLKEEFDSL
jgi:hypothetical protein